MKATGVIRIEGARIGFRNFEGKAGKFNPPGNRNFCVFLDYDLGRDLEQDGWNVRWLEPRDESEDKQPYLQVAVNFEVFPPTVIMITSSGKTALTEETVQLLDWAEIINVDIIIRPYNWEVNGKSGVKAYVKSMYVTLAEDDFERKYKNVPDSALNSLADPNGSEPF